MSRLKMTRWVVAAGALCAVGVAGVALRPAPTAAQAGVPPVVSVGDRATVAADIMVSVPVTFTCAPRSPDTLISAFISLEQAVSGRIAHNLVFYNNNPNFSAGGGPFPSPVVCDNTAQTFVAPVLADTSGAAFSTGQSIVTVSVTICTLQGFGGTDCATTTVGPRVINQVRP